MKILTDEKFAEIPGLLAQGLSKTEIAEMFGVKATTLQAKCGKRRISLGVKGRPRKHRLPCVAEPTQLALANAATARGITVAALVEQLLEIIVQDKLYDAILGTVAAPVVNDYAHYRKHGVFVAPTD